MNRFMRSWQVLTVLYSDSTMSFRHQLSHLYLLLNYSLIMHRNINKKYVNRNWKLLIHTSTHSCIHTFHRKWIISNITKSGDSNYYKRFCLMIFLSDSIFCIRIHCKFNIFIITVFIQIIRKKYYRRLLEIWWC